MPAGASQARYNYTLCRSSRNGSHQHSDPPFQPTLRLAVVLIFTFDNQMLAMPEASPLALLILSDGEKGITYSGGSIRLDPDNGAHSPSRDLETVESAYSRRRRLEGVPTEPSALTSRRFRQAAARDSTTPRGGNCHSRPSTKKFFFFSFGEPSINPPHKDPDTESASPQHDIILAAARLAMPCTDECRFFNESVTTYTFSA